MNAKIKRRTEDLEVMEQRKHPRVQLPLIVSLLHPALKDETVTVRDISEDGVYVEMANPTVKVGAKIKLTLINPSSLENQATPTVAMEVVRIEDDGMGLKFANKTNKHLWNSVERLRTELEVGRDYFQVHQSLILTNAKQQILIAKKGGSWLFPGHYLVVGEHWRETLEAVVTKNFGITDVVFSKNSRLQSQDEQLIPEAATVKLVHYGQTSVAKLKLTNDADYSDIKWVDKPAQVEELTFVSDFYRLLAIEAVSSEAE